MSLTDQFPKQYAEWVKAGYQDDAFRDHLLGIQVLKPTNADIFRIYRRMLNQIEGMVSVLQPGK